LFTVTIAGGIGPLERDDQGSEGYEGSNPFSPNLVELGSNTLVYSLFRLH